MVGIVTVPTQKMGVCLAIMLATAGINWIFNYAVERQNFHEKSSNNNRIMNAEAVSEVFEITKTNNQ